MKVAVIPARGGSKRIPRKNIRMFCGKPMITWSIEAARRAGCFDHIICSTDDDEIAGIAERAGAVVPFRRPSSLADDFSGTTAVIGHAVRAISDLGLVPELVCCVYPTAPFVRPDDLLEGLARIEAEDLDFVFPVTPYDFPVQRCVRRDDQGRISMLYPEHFRTRSQDLEVLFHDAGQFYWGRSQAWLEERIIFSSRSASIVLPGARVRDIDTEDDWAIAEAMFRASMHEGSGGVQG